MTSIDPESALDVEAAVRDRYSRGAAAPQPELCCPQPADGARYDFLPDEVVAKDYGCGDPSEFVREGDTVLDLGSGAGRICFMASHRVGPNGRVIGVDMNDEMLGVARGHVDAVAKSLGYGNVEFRKGKIQDLALDYDAVEHHLREHPVRDAEGLSRFESHCDQLRRERPMVADGSVDLVVSNCVLNLVRDGDMRALFSEIYRVLRRGGRIAISDIVVDEDVPDAMKNDAELWSGCLSGALREDRFLSELERVGFYGIEIASRSDAPWQVVDGYEFRSMTVTARKGKEGPCLERNQAVIYRGPFKQVLDDDGHLLPRGQRVAVCDKTFQILSGDAYRGQIISVPPYRSIALEDAGEFACRGGAEVRSPRVTKEGGPSATLSCDPEGGCC